MDFGKGVFAVLALMLLVSVPGVMADETGDAGDSGEITAADEAETATMTNALGAQVRLLQLEKALAKSVITGEIVVEAIVKNHPEEDVSELNSILDEMELLVEEVQGMSAEGDAGELAQQYVDIKSAARGLAKEFREAVKGILTTEDRREIVEAGKETGKELLEELGEAIRNAKREMNAYHVENVLAAMGTENPELIEQIANGKAELARVRENVRSAFGSLDSGEKTAALAKIREMKAKRNVSRKAALDKARERFTERKEVRNANIEQNREQRRTETAAPMAAQERLRRLEANNESFGDRGQALQAIVEDARPGATASSATSGRRQGA